jgi:hypothetical protein
MHKTANMIGTAVFPFTVPPFTVSLLFSRLFHFSEIPDLSVLVKLIYDFIYHAPPFTVQCAFFREARQIKVPLCFPFM